MRVKEGLITCIVPVFNGERYLSAAIDSILAQTYSPLEIIVVDDGSIDGTDAVVHAYGKRVSYLKQSNAGSAAARNLGLSAANGEFVAFLDADDLWHPSKLGQQMARFWARPELDCCVTYVQNFWIAELREEERRFRDHRIAKALPGYIASTLFARRNLFDTVGQFDPVLRHGDTKDWFLRVAEHGATMELLPDVLVYRRLHETNFSRHVSAALEEHLQVVKASLDRRRQKGTSPRAMSFQDRTWKKEP